MDVRDVVARRSDLSTFLVHLTRDTEGGPAPVALRSMLGTGRIEARSPFGHAKLRLLQGGRVPASQRCVCFTETPLEYTHLLLAKIDNRDVQFRPYGIAITKRLARQRGVNPVWYLDITPGHDWLAANLDNVLDRCLANGAFTDPDVERLVPYVEQMGTRRAGDGHVVYRKEFWWEREWRYCGGHFKLPQRFIGLCPAEEIDEFQELAKKEGFPVRFLDPRWGLEQIIAQLAGFKTDDVEIL
jgi:abortive phage resistance protein AbiGi (putative antitoxin)